jgi:hypothetical protein
MKQLQRLAQFAKNCLTIGATDYESLASSLVILLEGSITTNL